MRDKRTPKDVCGEARFRQSSPARSPTPFSPSRQEREPQQQLSPEIQLVSQPEQSLPPRDEPTHPPPSTATHDNIDDDDNDNDNDNDDDDDMSSDDDDDDEFEDVDELSDNVPSLEVEAVESQPLFSSADPEAANSAVCTPPDSEIKDAEINDAEESQIPFSSPELPSDQPSDQPSGQSPPVLPESKQESGFGPMRTTRRSFSRRHPAPMPEALEALHRIATNPAPVLSGRAARSDPAVPAESRSGLPPLLILVFLILGRPLESLPSRS